MQKKNKGAIENAIADESAVDLFSHVDSVKLANATSASGKIGTGLGGYSKYEDAIYMMIVSKVAPAILKKHDYQKPTTACTAYPSVFTQAFYDDHVTPNAAAAKAIACRRAKAYRPTFVSHTLAGSDTAFTNFCSAYPQLVTNVIRPILLKAEDLGSELSGKGHVVYEIFFRSPPMTIWEYKVDKAVYENSIDPTVKPTKSAWPDPLDSQMTFTELSNHRFYFSCSRDIGTLNTCAILIHHFMRPADTNGQIDVLELNKPKGTPTTDVNLRYPYKRVNLKRLNAVFSNAVPTGLTPDVDVILHYGRPSG